MALVAAEEAQLISLLGKAEQPYSLELAEALLRRVPNIAIELVVMRHLEDSPCQVLLTQRAPEKGDPWAGLWHCPGTVIRSSDRRGILDALDRLEEKEIGAKLQGYEFVGDNAQPNFGGRMLTIQLIFMGKVAADAPVKGLWYNIGSLPKDIIPEHLPMIGRAAGKFCP